MSAATAHRCVRAPVAGLACALIAGLACALAGCEPPPVAALAPAAKVPVTVQTLRAAAIRPVIQAFGVVEAVDTVDVNVDFTAIVKRMRVDVGDRVSAGELLAVLDAQKLELNRQRAEQGVAAAAAAQAEAESNWRRRASLGDEGIVTAEELDHTRAMRDSRRASHREAQAQLALAVRALADSEVRAPVNGVIDTRRAGVGETVLAGTPLFRLQAVDALRTLVWVGEAQVNALRVGVTATVSFRAWPGRSAPARIDSIGINADPQTGNFPVRLLLPKNVFALRPGMTASVRILGLPVPGALLLPEAALVDRHRRKTVFVLRDGVAVATAPALAAGFSDRIVVLSGLADGDRVIVSNLARLVDGVAVQARASTTAIR